MNPFIELMQAGAFIMLLFAAVLISVVIRNTAGARMRTRLGPAVIGLALLLFAVPIYASVIGVAIHGVTDFARPLGAILLPVGLYLLGLDAGLRSRIDERRPASGPDEKP